MDENKALEVLELYRKKLQEMNVPIKEFGQNAFLPAREQALAHCHWMAIRAASFLKDGSGSIGKAKRWLGFIQGALWSAGIYNINEMRHHNHPEPPAEPR